MWKRDIIRIPGYMIATIIALVVVLFATIILIGNKKAKNYIRATYSTEILNVLITGDERYGYLRGAVFYKTDHYVATSAKFIGKSLRNDIWKSHGPIVDYDTIPYEYTLYDLKFPYALSKRKNNDTIIITIDTLKLKFLVIE